MRAGEGIRLLPSGPVVGLRSSRMMSRHRRMHSLQMFTFGPEMIFSTSRGDLLQKEHVSPAFGYFGIRTSEHSLLPAGRGLRKKHAQQCTCKGCPIVRQDRGKREVLRQDYGAVVT